MALTHGLQIRADTRNASVKLVWDDHAGTRTALWGNLLKSVFWYVELSEVGFNGLAGNNPQFQTALWNGAGMV